MWRWQQGKSAMREAAGSADQEAARWLTRAGSGGHVRAQRALGELYSERFHQYGLAAEWFRKAAGQGDARAQTSLGWAYSCGQGVERDDTQAVAWYRKAAEQDCLSCDWAQRNLAWMYVSGRGVAKDYAQAVDWYRKAARGGDRTSEYNLGVAYRDGLGVGADDVKAAAWFKKASARFRPGARNLEALYPLGRRVARDKTERARASTRFRLGWIEGDGSSVNRVSEVLPLLSEAAERGDASAQYILGRMQTDESRADDGVPHDNAAGVRWLRKAADQGYAPAQFVVGWASRAGEGGTGDDAQAADWFRKAAEQGHALAQAALGRMYWYGQGVSRDEAQARLWMGLALGPDGGDRQADDPEQLKRRYEAVERVRDIAAKGDVDAQVEYGMMWSDGRAGYVDYRSAAQWLRKAAERENVKAQYHLGLLYKEWISDTAYDVGRFDADAVRWFRKAAEHGNADAQYYLGVAYRDGEGTDRDVEQAARWFGKAAEQGHAVATKELAAMRKQGGGETAPAQ